MISYIVKFLARETKNGVALLYYTSQLVAKHAAKSKETEFCSELPLGLMGGAIGQVVPICRRIRATQLQSIPSGESGN